MDLSTLEKTSRETLDEFKKGGRVLVAMLTSDTGLVIVREDNEMYVFEELKSGPDSESSHLAALIVAAAVGLADDHLPLLVHDAHHSVQLTVVASTDPDGPVIILLMRVH